MDDQSTQPQPNQGDIPPQPNPLPQVQPQAQTAAPPQPAQQPQPVSQPNPQQPQSQNPQPMQTTPAPQMGPPTQEKKSGKKRLLVKIFGLLGITFIGLAVVGLLFGGSELGALKENTYHSDQDYAYSVSFFENAEIESVPTGFIPTTLAGDIATTKRDDDKITSVTYVVVEDIATAIEFAGVTVTRDELYTAYLSGEANATLENLISSALDLDDVDLSSDITEWSNDHFSDGIRGELVAETTDGVDLKGYVVFSIEQSDRFGYTLVALAPTRTWDKNEDAFKQIESSFRTN